MKYFLLFSLIISSSSYSVAVVDDPAKCDTCKPVLSGTAESALPADYKKVARAVAGAPSPNIDSLAFFICDAYQGRNPVPKIKKAILTHMASDPDYKNYPNPSKGLVLKFLNRNRNYMNCYDGRNYMMVAFDNGSAHDSLFNALLIDDLGEEGEFNEGEKLNVNAVSFTGPNESPETVLDYMNRIKDDPRYSSYRDEIVDLIDYFKEELNARTYAKLDDEDRNLTLVSR